MSNNRDDINYLIKHYREYDHITTHALPETRSGLWNNLGKRVKLRAMPSYITERIKRGYCLARLNMLGRIISVSPDGTQYGVEFDDKIWTPIYWNRTTRSQFDTGCYAAGTIGYCAFLKPGHILIENEHVSLPAFETTDNLLLLAAYS